MAFAAVTSSSVLGPPIEKAYQAPEMYRFRDSICIRKSNLQGRICNSLKDWLEKFLYPVG